MSTIAQKFQSHKPKLRSLWILIVDNLSAYEGLKPESIKEFFLIQTCIRLKNSIGVLIFPSIKTCYSHSVSFISSLSVPWHMCASIPFDHSINRFEMCLLVVSRSCSVFLWTNMICFSHHVCSTFESSRQRLENKSSLIERQERQKIPKELAEKCNLSWIFFGP